MANDKLADYFYGIAAKRLSLDDVHSLVSERPELVVPSDLDHLLGLPEPGRIFPSTLVYLCEKTDQPFFNDADVRWCGPDDENGSQPTGRKLCCRDTTVTSSAAPGDTLLIARRYDNSLLIAIAENESTDANQLRWLFSLTNMSSSDFVVRLELNSESDRIDFARYFLLEKIGVMVNI